MKYDIFISYSSKDVKLVRCIAQALHVSGINVYCDDLAGHGMVHGREDVEAISNLLVKHLNDSAAMIVIDTDNTWKSKWVRFETSFFKALNRPIHYIKF